ncbi:unnamed protein product [Acanthoscelides obtectus]|uniref:Uncharacterized protein n=1 Tax=Acanthoscelides obtectus TaxID=200917 RepID=A0A9P0M5P0_ACAOB|nr:unnamed protein product [Acanthoscelides obtectus]CAK1624302.1 Putative OPA3-like protein CG13603 [Acanthoscelides obtectus]
MVIGAFPAAKLGALLLKQISKPIANVVKNQAKSSPIFRKYVCMPPAQFYNWCEVKAKMWILNLGKPVNIPVLSESMAIELGANLLVGYDLFYNNAAFNQNDAVVVYIKESLQTKSEIIFFSECTGVMIKVCKERGSQGRSKKTGDEGPAEYYWGALHSYRGT